MNETTHQPSPPQTPKRAHPFLWLFLGFVMLICTGAAGAIYVEHRLQQYHATQEALLPKQAEVPAPSTAMLRMLSALQTKVKQLEQSGSNTAELENIRQAAIQVSTESAQHSEKIATLEAQIAKAEARIAELDEALKAQTSPVNTYAAVLRNFLQLKQHIGSKEAASDLSAFKTTLDAIAISPKQLAARARIAEQASHIEAALTHDVPTHEMLSEELHDAIATIKPKPNDDSTTTEEAPSQGFWDKLAALSRRHVRIEPEADAKAREDYDTLSELDARDDFLAAARTISAMDHASEQLIAWRARAKNFLTISRALDAIEADLSSLTQES